MSRINCFGTEDFFGSPLQGYALIQLNNMTGPDPQNEYREGCWGLTYCNDPDFVFYMPPRVETSLHYEVTVEHYQELLQGPIGICYRLWKACLDTGYDPNEHGYVLGYWLVNHLGQHLKDNFPAKYCELVADYYANEKEKQTTSELEKPF